MVRVEGDFRVNCGKACSPRCDCSGMMNTGGVIATGNFSSAL